MSKVISLLKFTFIGFITGYVVSLWLVKFEKFDIEKLNFKELD